MNTALRIVAFVATRPPAVAGSHAGAKNQGAYNRSPGWTRRASLTMHRASPDPRAASKQDCADEEREY